jgi:4-amino-4-deoxy-L-arabinose transferase-like glycosyltransferase
LKEDMTSSADSAGSTTTDPDPLPVPPAEAESGPEAKPEDPAGAGARWRRFWRSPADQPPWARPILLVIAAIATAMYSWNITSAGYAPFYSSSVKSMSVSWKAWLFGAMDPGATITLDKIPGSFAIQALSARIFGFNEFAVTLPQVIEGVIAVLVLYRVVRRWAGPAAGLIAAGLFTFTPVVASMFGHSMEDGALTCCLVLAADRLQYGVTQGRLRSLIWAGFWVGVGFQMKMMQAWMVLPAFALVYLLSAPGPLRRRLWHTLAAGAVCIAVSLTWVVMMEVVPASDRPYVDGSTNNSAIAMVFGYNGLERFGINLPGAVVDSLGSGGSGGGGGAGAGRGGFGGGERGSFGDFPQRGGQGAEGASGFPGGAGGAGTGAGAGAGAEGREFPGGAGRSGGGFAGGGGGGGFGGAGTSSKWLKLFEGRFANQIGWMIPLALLSIVLGLWSRRRAERTDVLRSGFMLWGGWLVVIGLIFSEMGSIPHTAYMSTLAPATSALSGAGMVLLWRAYRRGERLGWVLPAAVAGQTAWTWDLWSGYAGFASWLRWLGVLVAGAAFVALIVARLQGRVRTRITAIAAAAALATMGVGTVAWASTAFNAKDDGSSFDASAGPQGGGGLGAGGGLTASGTLTGDQSKLWTYVSARQDGAEYPLATIGWMNAQDYILATGAKVLPIGGFSGLVPEPSVSAFTQLVQQGQVHYVLTGGAGIGGGGGGGGFAGGSTTTDTAATADTQIQSWVQAHCTAVPSTDYGVAAAATTTSNSSPFGGGGGGGGLNSSGSLYHCGRSS